MATMTPTKNVGTSTTGCTLVRQLNNPHPSPAPTPPDLPPTLLPLPSSPRLCIPSAASNPPSNNGARALPAWDGRPYDPPEAAEPGGGPDEEEETESRCERAEKSWRTGLAREAEEEMATKADELESRSSWGVEGGNAVRARDTVDRTAGQLSRGLGRTEQYCEHV